MSDFFDEDNGYLGIGFAIPNDYSIIELGYEDDIREVEFGSNDDE